MNENEQEDRPVNQSDEITAKIKRVRKCGKGERGTNIVTPDNNCDNCWAAQHQLGNGLTICATIVQLYDAIVEATKPTVQMATAEENPYPGILTLRQYRLKQYLELGHAIDQPPSLEELEALLPGATKISDRFLFAVITETNKAKRARKGGH